MYSRFLVFFFSITNKVTFCRSDSKFTYFVAENVSTSSNLQLMSRQSSLNEDDNSNQDTSINDLSEVLNQGKTKVRIPSPPSFFVSRRELEQLEQKSRKDSASVQVFVLLFELSLSTSCLIFPLFAPDPTIFEKGNFLLLRSKRELKCVVCTFCLPRSSGEQTKCIQQVRVIEKQKFHK